MADNYLQVVDPADNVTTAIREVEAGETVVVAVSDEERRIDVTEDVRFGHKLAIENLSKGGIVRKYGKSIGSASEDISAGEYVHVHNVESNCGRGARRPLWRWTGPTTTVSAASASTTRTTSGCLAATPTSSGVRATSGSG